ncbi:MAG: YafY family protein [Nevskia sp.]|nr:YafY family protein [Nevskia sp.]
MRRADRLFQIVQYLRGRRLTTAAQLSDWLGVSARTVYRDIQDLERTGVPVEGEAGVGYRLRPGFDLPPLMFTFAEIEALVAGARMIGGWGSPELRQASELALAKIAAALPEHRRIELERTRLYALNFARDGGKDGDVLDTLRHVIAGRVVTLLDYKDAVGQASTRHVWPLGLYFWGHVWALAAWCELRQDFRNFRLDRIAGAFSSERQYPDQAGRRLEDFVRAMRGKDKD